MRSDIFKRHQEVCKKNRKHGGARKKKANKAKLSKAKRVAKKLAIFTKATKPKSIKKRLPTLNEMLARAQDPVRKATRDLKYQIYFDSNKKDVIHHAAKIKTKK